VAAAMTGADTIYVAICRKKVLDPD